MTHEASAAIEDSFACIPRKGYLLTGPPIDTVEFSTPFGDFVLPRRLRPAKAIPDWSFSSGTDGFYFTLPGKDVFPALANPPALLFDFDPYDRLNPSLGSHVYGPDGQEIVNKAGLEAVGFAVNAFGLLAGDAITAERTDNEMLAFDTAGNIVTSIDCSPEGWCRHGILGPTVLAGPGTSNTLWVTYSADLLPHWPAIEAAARSALESFPVSGVVPAEKQGRRPAPACIAYVQKDGRCLAFDRLP